MPATLEAVRAERQAHLDDAKKQLQAASRSLVSVSGTYEGESAWAYDELANLVSHTLAQLERDDPDEDAIVKALRPLRKADDIRRGLR
jgi:hypothetical protein